MKKLYQTNRLAKISKISLIKKQPRHRKWSCVILFSIYEMPMCVAIPSILFYCCF
jgi:hypothetical protein